MLCNTVSHIVWRSGRPCFLFFWPGGLLFWPRSGFFAVFGTPLAGFFSAKMQGPAPAVTRSAPKSFEKPTKTIDFRTLP